MKKLISILLALAMCIGFAGCQRNQGSGQTHGNSGSDKLKVSVVVPGARGDLGFTDSLYNGVLEVQKKYGDKVEVSFMECNRDSSKFESTIYDVCDASPDLVVAPAGSGFADYITQAAREYQDTDFYIVDINAAYGNISTDNVTALAYKQNEATFLTGALAAKLSQTGTVGYVAGMSNAVINDFTVGYIQGAQYANPDIRVIVSYIGDFLDGAKAKELATSQIGMGADVVHQVAGTAGLGVLDAAKEADVWGIGVDSDQGANYANSDPVMADHIASSAMKNGGEMLVKFMDRYMSGDSSIKWGGIESMGIVDGAVAIAKGALWEKNIPEEVRTYVEELEKKIISGEIKVVSAFDISEEEFNGYVESCQK